MLLSLFHQLCLPSHLSFSLVSLSPTWNLHYIPMPQIFSDGSHLLIPFAIHYITCSYMYVIKEWNYSADWMFCILAINWLWLRIDCCVQGKHMDPKCKDSTLSLQVLVCKTVLFTTSIMIMMKGERAGVTEAVPTQDTTGCVSGWIGTEVPNASIVIRY